MSCVVARLCNPCRHTGSHFSFLTPGRPNGCASPACRLPVPFAAPSVSWFSWFSWSGFLLPPPTTPGTCMFHVPPPRASMPLEPLSHALVACQHVDQQETPRHVRERQRRVFLLLFLSCFSCLPWALLGRRRSERGHSPDKWDGARGGKSSSCACKRSRTR